MTETAQDALAKLTHIDDAFSALGKYLIENGQISNLNDHSHALELINQGCGIAQSLIAEFTPPATT